MKGFMKEFKEFISRGNVMDMAVGIIIGGAFTAIVNSLVEDIINPLLFLIMAFILFSIIKAMNKAASIGKKEEEPAAPTTKMCPYCKSEIAIEATRCPHCTSQL